MPRIAPVAWENLADDARARIEAGLATGMYSTPVPLQICAHSPNALRGLDEGYKAVFGRSAMGQRLQELVRLRSAQLGSCEPCSLSRKDESMTDFDTACLVDPPPGMYTERERLALRFVDLMAVDHHAIDTAFFRELAREFTAEEVVELGWYIGQAIGTHRFMHALDILGTEPPVFADEAVSS
jgi:alkylhydroperoxidase family enzyme